jgi:anti-sigma factor (TIGR02949 family)
MRHAARTGEIMETNRMSCDEAVRLFFAYLDRALAGETLEDLDDHVEHCVSCCDKLEFSRKLDAFVKTRLADASLPDGLEDRIRRAIGL